MVAVSLKKKKKKKKKKKNIIFFFFKQKTAYEMCDSDWSSDVCSSDLYVGASLEAGNVWASTDDVSFASALTAGSLFVVMDTLLGPLYLGYGVGEGDRRSAYLFLGQTF